MSTIFSLFMVLIIIACVLLVIIIMAQNPKGGGLSATFGGSSAQFGVQRTNDFMEKATWTLGATIVVLIFLSIILTGKPTLTAPAMPTPVKSEAPANAPVNNAPANSTPAAK